MALTALPALYTGYMAWVWRTSRVCVEGLEPARRLLEERGGFVGLLWHEDSARSNYGWARLGVHPHILVNASFAGDISAALARRCGYTVIRGGASSGTRRKRPAALREMIEHMSRNEGVVYGIAVDGSQGPPYRLKRGALVIARECDMPIALVRAVSSRCLRLPTWDRMAVPLPFGRIRVTVDAPHFVPPSARSKQELLRVAETLEARLLSLAADSLRALERPLPAALSERLDAARLGARPADGL
jgi:lysophospholipid acyltransferase (LPLAT)-like uncharacterized protein